MSGNKKAKADDLGHSSNARLYVVLGVFLAAAAATAAFFFFSGSMGKLSVIGLLEEPLTASDGYEDNYGEVEFSLPEELLKARGRKSGQLFIATQIAAADAGNTEVLVRLSETTGGLERRYDAIVNVQAPAIRLRAEHFDHAAAQREGSDGVKITLIGPEYQPESSYRIRIYPAATESVGGAYSRAATGSIEIRTIDVAVAERNALTRYIEGS